MDFSKGCQIYPNLAEQLQDLDIGILGILLITIVSSFCDMHLICHISNAWPKDPKVKAAMMSYSYIHKFKAYTGVICNTVTPAINIIILYYYCYIMVHCTIHIIALRIYTCSDVN